MIQGKARDAFSGTVSVQVLPLPLQKRTTRDMDELPADVLDYLKKQNEHARKRAAAPREHTKTTQ